MILRAPFSLIALIVALILSLGSLLLFLNLDENLLDYFLTPALCKAGGTADIKGGVGSSVGHGFPCTGSSIPQGCLRYLLYARSQRHRGEQPRPECLLPELTASGGSCVIRGDKAGRAWLQR